MVITVLEQLVSLFAFLFHQNNASSTSHYHSCLYYFFVYRVLAAKFAAYSQLEVVRTGMLSRHVKAKDARVLQLGGTTRDLFYYPNGTVQVTAAEENLKDGLWEQAGMQAGVPVRPLKSSSASALSNSAGAAFDSVVAFDQLGSITEYKKYFSDVWRVLKPGGTFIFIQRVSGSPVSSLVRLGGPPATGRLRNLLYFDQSPWNISYNVSYYIFVIYFLQHPR